ncbi:MAG: DUF2520 domain-containing protein [Massilibacteroides sp.]|nr:DUF2520 domain-containing protein [Massilibacteroides sp.]MDD3061680.1 DUF2520 domain-containing protein [Massilibacteroides sp.]MDD4114402.1 DUF2520 domain-containing protein [Massilibacteroides sp.]MDD4660275.1 DUF2520 domain-containing protein [Massilibacteroides sp.]
MKIVFIGAGNLATSLAKAMQSCGLNICQVYSRTPESASSLAQTLRCPWTTSIEEVKNDANWYIFSVKDDALEELISRLKPNNGLWLHTAGSMSTTIFEGFTSRYGVIYPLQTFSKQRSVDFSNIPFILEANNPEDLRTMKEITGRLTNDVHILNSEARKQIHLAAVFACNFANHMWTLAWQLLEDKQIPPGILFPLIKETAAKLKEMPPRKAQTGPAVRYDKKVIDKHLQMLDNESLKTIYRLLSQSIHETEKKSNE